MKNWKLQSPMLTWEEEDKLKKALKRGDWCVFNILFLIANAFLDTRSDPAQKHFYTLHKNQLKFGYSISNRDKNAYTLN